MKTEKHWIRFISGIIIFYGLEILERNVKLSWDIFTTEPIVLKYFSIGSHSLANTGIAPELYLLFQILAIIFIVSGAVGILKNKFSN